MTPQDRIKKWNSSYKPGAIPTWFVLAVRRLANDAGRVAQGHPVDWLRRSTEMSIWRNYGTVEIAGTEALLCQPPSGLAATSEAARFAEAAGLRFEKLLPSLGVEIGVCFLFAKPPAAAALMLKPKGGECD